MKSPNEIIEIIKQDPRCRLRENLGENDWDDGCWMTIRIKTIVLTVVASWGIGWDHVSASTTFRCPTWDELCEIKKIFWGPEEWVIQYMPPETENLNYHNYCLHMWRLQGETISTPPKWMV